MLFEIPDLMWWAWALIALCGILLARFFWEYENQFAGLLAILLFALSTMCGLLAIFEWIKG